MRSKASQHNRHTSDRQGVKLVVDGQSKRDPRAVDGDAIAPLRVAIRREAPMNLKSAADLRPRQAGGDEIPAKESMANAGCRQFELSVSGELSDRALPVFSCHRCNWNALLRGLLINKSERNRRALQLRL